MNIDYDEAAVEQVSYMLDLREPNQLALDAIARAMDGAEPGAQFIANLATGVGKTYIAGGLLDYLWQAGVRNVVLIAPGSTILRKTVDNLTPGHPKYLRGLQCNPLVVTLDTLERGEVGQALEDESRFKVFVFTVQSLLRPNKEDRRRAHSPHETVGQGLYEYLQGREDLVVIADEHHVYYSGSAKKFESAIHDLQPLALVGLTATPHEATKSAVVYRYPLSEAIADGWVKIPVLVSRQDGVFDTRTQLADGLTLLDAKAEAMRAYCAKHRNKKYVEPVLFVVAQTIQEATEYRDLLIGKDMIGDPDKVLLITSEQPDATLAQLDQLENPSSQVRAVVSVSMLKEGWDVKNIYVIASVRSMESQLLTEQILGRGLRLPFGERTGNPMLDTVEVLSHHSFASLLKRARALLEETLGDRVQEAAVVADPVPGVRQEPMPLGPGEGNPLGMDLSWATDVDVLLPGPAATDPHQDALFTFSPTERHDGEQQAHVGMKLSTIEARVASAGTATAVLERIYTARAAEGVRLPLFLPRVVTRWERDPFSLAQVNLMSVEALGRRFADDDVPALIRKALDAERDDQGRAHTVIRDEDTVVKASTLPIPFDLIENDLVTRLMRTNGIEQTITEANASLAVAKAFLVGAGVTEDTPWRAEHGRLATTRLTEWITNQQTSSPAREVREVEHVRWPDPAERTFTAPPQNRQLITSSRDFVRGYPYQGWERGVYEVTTFDAYSTEFSLATIFENPASRIRAWVRIDATVPLRIIYLIGAVQRSYEPDFIVVDEHGVYWIVEGKSDRDMASPEVIAKRDAARDWVHTVNASADVPEHWAYLLASESVITNASTWDAAKNGGQAFS